jgi:hypothetical protein
MAGTDVANIGEIGGMMGSFIGSLLPLVADRIADSISNTRCLRHGGRQLRS